MLNILSLLSFVHLCCTSYLNPPKFKYSQKTKYFIYGAIATAIFLPLAGYAMKSISVTFREGDVLSASVLNSLMSRINDVQQGYTSPEQLNGSWTCTTFSPTKNDDTRCVPDGLFFKKSGTLTLDSSASKWSYAGNGGNDGFAACGMFPSSGDFELLAGRIIADDSSSHPPYVFFLNRISPYKFSADTGVNGSFIECTKNSTEPEPPDALTASLSGSSVALNWIDQSTDETGFKVQYKTSVKGGWSTATTTLPNATSYTLSGLAAATYWIRVLATNDGGDSMSSSEVQVVVQ